MTIENVWIVDLTGYSREFGYGGQQHAHWLARHKVVRFGGMQWHHVPDMPATAAPTEDECTEWATSFPKPEPEPSLSTWALIRWIDSED
jgi:hypothetical protein